ncbi:hypothetical protein A4R44_04196 [Amycolatopsis sp. M39]|nr:hypothetical protein A4R44_04196 [Amycolatopsis sp. M39]
MSCRPDGDPATSSANHRTRVAVTSRTPGGKPARPDRRHEPHTRDKPRGQARAPGSPSRAAHPGQAPGPSPRARIAIASRTPGTSPGAKPASAGCRHEPNIGTGVLSNRAIFMDRGTEAGSGEMSGGGIPARIGGPEPAIVAGTRYAASRPLAGRKRPPSVGGDPRAPSNCALPAQDHMHRRRGPQLKSTRQKRPTQPRQRSTSTPNYALPHKTTCTDVAEA